MKKTMAAVVIGLMVGFSCPWRAFAAVSFPSEDIQVLDSKGIAALTDEKLTENYIDMLAEIEATRMFHMTSGFTLKEYNKYKDLIKYRVGLLFEINRRKLDTPPNVN